MTGAFTMYFFANSLAEHSKKSRLWVKSTLFTNCSKALVVFIHGYSVDLQGWMLATFLRVCRLPYYKLAVFSVAFLLPACPFSGCTVAL